MSMMEHYAKVVNNYIFLTTKSRCVPGTHLINLGKMKGFIITNKQKNKVNWIKVIMSEYARIYVNMPKSTSIAFVLHVPIVITCLLECMVTYFNEIYSQKEYETVYLKRQKKKISIVTGSI